MPELTWTLALAVAGVAVGLLLGSLPVLLLGWWLDRRAQRTWDRRWAAQERRHALQRQLRAMEAAIRDEGLSAEERVRLRYYQAREAEVRREARRRLGLPEEEGEL